jgi:hypothetical protein
VAPLPVFTHVVSVSVTLQVGIASKLIDAGRTNLVVFTWHP